MTSASSSYLQIVGEVQSMLTKHGYASKGQTSRLILFHNCGLIAFQRSSSSTKNAIRFTINVGIVLGILLPPPVIERLKSCTVVDGHSSIRVGFLMDVARDLWWTVRDGEDSRGICQEVIAAVEERVVPFVQRFIAPGAIAELWKAGKSHGLTDVTRQDYLKLYLSKVSQDQSPG